MRYQDFNQLGINGHWLTGANIISYCRSQKEANLQHLATFMEEWLSDDASLSLKTSGSTGKPKLIRVQKTQLLSSAAMTAEFFHFRPAQKAILCLPMNYIAAKMMVVRALYSKLELITIEPGLTPLKDFNYSGLIDFAPLIPSQIQNIHPQLKIRQILIGGAGIDHALEASLKQRPEAIYQSYGMTETLSHIALRKINGVGATPYYTALKGVGLSTDGRGCLCLRVPFLLEALQTNDLVELIGINQFIWKGRHDNIINSGGLKFSPELIEHQIGQCIQSAYFIASLPDSQLGEKIVLFLEQEPLSSQGYQKLKRELRICLSKYEQPKTIICLPHFQRTPSGKIQRRQTLQTYLNQRDLDL